MIVFGVEFPPDHQVMQFGNGRVGGGHARDNAAVPHDVHAVADRQHLIEAVRDEHEARALLEGSNPLEQDLDIGAFEDGGRLVEQDHEVARDPVFKRQRLCELDHLSRGKA